MKKLLMCLLLMVTTSALADYEIAVMENAAGGRIVLTQQNCPMPESVGFRLAYTSSTNQRIYGCWRLQKSNQTVHVLWVTPDGESHHKTYDSNGFELLKLI